MKPGVMLIDPILAGLSHQTVIDPALNLESYSLSPNYQPDVKSSPGHSPHQSYDAAQRNGDVVMGAKSPMNASHSPEPGTRNYGRESSVYGLHGPQGDPFAPPPPPLFEVEEPGEASLPPKSVKKKRRPRREEGASA